MAQKTHGTQTEWQTKHEDLLIAIDQLEQITEVMNEVLGRVKKQVATLENSSLPPSIKKVPISKKTKTNTAHKAKKASLVH